MEARAVASWIACLGAMIPAQGPALSGEATPQEPEQAEVCLSDADRTPMVVLWKTGDEPAVTLHVAELTEGFKAAAGEGGLVAVRKGFAPVSLKLTLEAGPFTAWIRWRGQPG